MKTSNKLLILALLAIAILSGCLLQGKSQAATQNTSVQSKSEPPEELIRLERRQLYGKIIPPFKKELGGFYFQFIDPNTRKPDVVFVKTPWPLIADLKTGDRLWVEIETGGLENHQARCLWVSTNKKTVKR